jgi:pSer/pThr/pTyr-binding forkhead associated (FHA) protein
MAVRLTITDRTDPGAELIRSFVQDRVVIGRARHCDVCLPDMAVSTRHAEIEVSGGDYVIVDRRSLNGTRIDGKRLVPLRPRVLKNGDQIEIAGFVLGFRLGVSPGPAEPRDQSMRQAREMLANLLSRSGGTPARRALLVVAGPGKARRFDLPDPPARLIVGRAKEVDFRLEDRDVSRRHAEVVLETDGTIRVRDLDSHNGVILDGERVAELVLDPAGSFTLGQTTLALEHPSQAPLNAILDAPEEQTSSFSPEVAEEREEPPGNDSTATDDPEELATDQSPPPVGPADPLAYPGQPGYVPTEREIPLPKTERGSDIGLILIGAIIVVAAVVGLILLFT